MAGESARGSALRGEQQRAPAGSSVRSIPAASLSSRTPSTATSGRPPSELGERLGERDHAAGVVGAVEDRERLLADHLKRARARATAAAAGARGLVELARGTPRAAARASAKLRRWKRPRRASVTPGSAGACTSRAPWPRRPRAAARIGVRVEPAEHERRAGAHDASFSRRCR